MGERLFSPWSLARVCEAVEWEDEITIRRDGTSNQEAYMKAMGILWERWMREWSIPDFARSLHDAGSGNFVAGLERIVKSLPERVYQLVGFYEGLWAGANPKAAGQDSVRTAAIPATGAPAEYARALLRELFAQLQEATRDY